MIYLLNNSWDRILIEERNKPYFKKLEVFLEKEYINEKVYPEYSDIFNSLKYTPLDQVKVVIIGQDPYHREGQAHGLCFSVKPGISPPPSLKNIFKEIENDLGIIQPPDFGDLTTWANQGVLLLNSIFTVREGLPLSHKNIGWEIFTDRIISEINKKQSPVVFFLWGNDAIKKSPLINNSIHKILSAPHPSPLSAHRGFFGCKHFSKANSFIKSLDMTPINWQL